MAGKAAQAERIRDLTKQIAGVGAQEMEGIEFTMISPGHALVRIYAVEDGRPLDVPGSMLNSVMTKTLDDGRFMFVADPANAPEYKIGDVKCFMHPDSPMSEIVKAVGLSGVPCNKSTLGSEHSKRIHGLHRHKQEWEAVQEYIENEKETKRETRQDEQLKATLAIADRGQTAVATPPRSVMRGECDICGKTGFKNVGSHKRGAHKEG